MSEQVTRELRLPASIDTVWQAIVAGSWLADRVELELRPGGEARFWEADGERRGWVEATLAPSASGSTPRRARLVFWWEREGEPATRVELSLAEEDPQLTLLRVRESRPLDALDLVATPLPGHGGSSYGPVLSAA